MEGRGAQSGWGAGVENQDGLDEKRIDPQGCAGCRIKPSSTRKSRIHFRLDTREKPVDSRVRGNGPFFAEFIQKRSV